MIISMHNWMRAEPVETTIRRLAKYGYDAIEISYDSVELSPGAPGTAAVRKMLKDNKIKCYGSISLMFKGRDLIHADRHGAVVIPENVAAKIPAACDLLTRKEAVILDQARKPGFSVAKLREAFEKMDDIH